MSGARVPVPEIVLGPPGTGKTTTLIGDVERALDRGVPPERIGYLSFTRRAAREAAERACKKFNKTPADFPYFRTLHSLCYRFLGLGPQDVFEGSKMQDFSEYAGVKITGRWSDDGSLLGFGMGDRILFMENLARIRGITLEEQYHEGTDRLPWSKVRQVVQDLHDFKEDNALMDYTDMLTRFVAQGVRPNIQELYVDEGQDLSYVQWDVVRLLARGVDRVVIAGDDDQAIYRWAGADVDKFIGLQGNVRVLGQSYRVPTAVQEVAMQPIGAIAFRREKAWAPRAEEGIVDRETAFFNCDHTGEDVLILARNDYILREQVEKVLRERGVIYEKHGFPSVRPEIVETITSWERLRSGKSITAGEARAVYKMMSIGVGVTRDQKELPAFKDEELVDMRALRASGGLMRDDIWPTALDLMTARDRNYILAARQHGEKLTKKPRVRISTIHGAKGGEADHVIVMKEMAKRTHSEMRLNHEDEARVWYVAATRARQRLTVVNSQSAQRCPWL
jgi:DNA helicase-2/ATP-dependent DNA helicase PcrA